MVFVQIHKGMKLNVTAHLAAQNIFAEEEEAIVRTRSYTTIGSDESKNALQNMRQDIDTIIMEMALYQCGFMIAPRLNWATLLRGQRHRRLVACLQDPRI